MADHLPLGAGVSLAVVLLTGLLLHAVVRGRRREGEMSNQASLLTTMLDLLPALIWAKDEQGRYVMVNEAVAKQTGLRKDEFIGRHATEVIAPDEVQKIVAWDRAAFAQPGSIVGGEEVLFRDGEVQYSLNSRRVCNVGGRLMIVGSGMDVTSLRRAEQELRSEMRRREAAQAELRQAQKMEAIGKLTGGIAHDFNNLLTSVLGNIDLAKAQMPDGRARLLLEKAEYAAQRGAKLIEYLLAFARKQYLKPRPIDLNQLILGMSDLLHHSIVSTIYIETLLEDGIWPALADANQIEMAVLNIAINARDAMPSGGRLTIRTANVKAGEPRLPSGLPSSDYVVITITDTGTGMTEDVLAKAFDPFFTTKDFGKGSGLGLSQVYGMAQQSGGTATIESRLGEGTSVSLFLPRAVEANRGETKTGSSDEEPGERRKSGRSIAR